MAAERWNGYLNDYRAFHVKEEHIFEAFTDAPLLPHQLKRLATRVSLDIRKFGSIGADSSGDIFLTFSTANSSNATSTRKVTVFLSNDQINPLFEATIQCVEESVVNSMIAAETTTGYRGVTVEAISHQHLIKILKKYDRLNDIIE